MRNLCKLLFTCFVLFGCNSNDDQLIPFCSVDNPVEDLSWLKNEITQREQNITEDSKYCYISQSFHNNQAVIIYADCNPFIDKIMPVYNCIGEIIGYAGDENFPFELLNQGQIIWKTNDFVCEL